MKMFRLSESRRLLEGIRVQRQSAMQTWKMTMWNSFDFVVHSLPTCYFLSPAAADKPTKFPTASSFQSKQTVNISHSLSTICKTNETPPLRSRTIDASDCFLHFSLCPLFVSLISSSVLKGKTKNDRVVKRKAREEDLNGTFHKIRMGEEEKEMLQHLDIRQPTPRAFCSLNAGSFSINGRTS